MSGARGDSNSPNEEANDAMTPAKARKLAVTRIREQIQKSADKKRLNDIIISKVRINNRLFPPF